ncbi:MAG: tetratricopeptide repeat protein [Pseudomonadota bacterium]
MRFLAAALLLLLLGCSTQLSPSTVRAYYSCNYGPVVSELKAKAKEDGKDYALYNLNLLSAAQGAGDRETAKQAFLNAQRLMWSTEAGKGRGTASLVSAESIKIFKGEPFEKSMAAIYGGILFFNEGDFDNARASFGKATMAIQQKEEHPNDFAVAYFLQALSFLKNGDTDNAKIALERAKKAYPNNPYLDVRKLKSSNAFFVIELGRGPERFRTGPGASLADWRRRSYPEQGAAVFVDDEEVGRAQEAGDLTYQATTKGWMKKDTVQVTKGVMRDASIVTAVVAADVAANAKNKKDRETAAWVALGAGLFALANQSQADIRQWEFLPDRLHVAAVRLSPGPHRLRVVFYGTGGVPISGYDKTWYYNPAAPDEEKIFLVRSGPC